MNYRKILLGIIAIVAVSCVNETKHKLSIPEYARNIKNTHVKGKSVLTGTCKTLINPSQLWMTGDSLIVIDNDNQYAYTLVSISGDSLITRFGLLGKSNEELLRPSFVQIDMDNNTYIYDDEQKLMHFNRIENITQKLDASAPLFFDEMSGGFLNRSYNGFIGDNIYGDGHIFTYYNNNGKPVVKFGLIPSTQANENINPDFYMAYQVQFMVSPDKKRLCAMGFYHDWLAFFDISGDRPKLIKEYFSEPPQVESSGKDNQFHIHTNDKTTIHYWSSTPFTDGLYINYIGAREIDFNNGKYNNYLFKCNWNGDIEQIYELDEKIGSIVSNKDGSMVYGLSMDYSNTDNMIIEYQFHNASSGL